MLTALEVFAGLGIVAVAACLGLALGAFLNWLLFDRRNR